MRLVCSLWSRVMRPTVEYTAPFMSAKLTPMAM